MVKLSVIMDNILNYPCVVNITMNSDISLENIRHNLTSIHVLFKDADLMFFRRVDECNIVIPPVQLNSSLDVEEIFIAVIKPFAASLVKGQGRIARKVKNSKDFNRRSAEEAFRSLVKTHEKYGWVTPALSDG